MTLHSTLVALFNSPLMLVWVGVAMFVGGIAIMYCIGKCTKRRGQQRRRLDYSAIEPQYETTDDGETTAPDTSEPVVAPSLDDFNGMDIVYYMEFSTDLAAWGYKDQVYVSVENEAINAAAAMGCETTTIRTITAEYPSPPQQFDFDLLECSRLCRKCREEDDHPEYERIIPRHCDANGHTVAKRKHLKIHYAPPTLAPPTYTTDAALADSKQ